MVSKRDMSKLLILAIALSSLAVFPQKKPSLDDLIAPAEQTQIGLGKLSRQEKKQLADKIFNLMLVAYQKGKEAATEKSTPAPSRQTAPAPRTTGRIYAAIGGGHWIQTNVNNGDFIVLEDGSLWKVDPLDKIDASLWLPVSEISVIEDDSGSPGYNYLLINTDDSEKAHAKYIGHE